MKYFIISILTTLFLDSIGKNGQIILGHQDDPVYGHTWCEDRGRSDVLECTGSYPGVMGWELGGLELGKDKNIDGVDFMRMEEEVKAQHRRGGINTFSWHATDPLKNNGSWNVNDTTLVSTMVNTEKGRDAYRKQLFRLACFFLNLKDDQGKPINVVFRPWHEHTGNWFWWGNSCCSKEDYIKLWHMMRQEFDSLGVHNIIWAYSPDRITSREQYLERYPGDSHVDLLGLDLYHIDGINGTDKYRESLMLGLKILREIGREKDKPFALTETGLEGVVIDNWFDNILLPIIKDSGISYVLLWRNAHNLPEHFYIPYRGHPAEKSFKKFAESPVILLTKDLKSL
jgi:beta-mannosidase